LRQRRGVAVQPPLLAHDFWPKFRRRWRAAQPRPLHAGLGAALLGKPPHGHRLLRPPLRVRPPAGKVALAYQPAAIGPGDGKARAHPALPSPHGLRNNRPLVRSSPARPAPRPCPRRPWPCDGAMPICGKAGPGTARLPRHAPGHADQGRQARTRHRPSRHAAQARPALWPASLPASTRTATANHDPGLAQMGVGPAKCPGLRLSLYRPGRPSSGKVPCFFANRLACSSSTPWLV